MGKRIDDEPSQMSLWPEPTKNSSGFLSRWFPQGLQTSVTRREILDTASLFISGVAVGVVIGGEIAQSRREQIDLSGLLDIDYTSSGKSFDLGSGTDFSGIGITDRKGYEEASAHLRDLLLPAVNPEYLQYHPVLKKVLSDFDQLSDDDLQKRITMFGEGGVSETGYQNGAFTDSRYLIRDEEGRPILGGYMAEQKGYSRMNLQLDQNHELVGGELDYVVRFQSEQLEDLLGEFFQIPDDFLLTQIFQKEGSNRQNNSLYLQFEGNYIKQYYDLYRFRIDQTGFMERRVYLQELARTI